MERISSAVFTKMAVGVNSTQIDGSSNDTSLGLQLEAVQSEADVHVLVAGAADREAAFGPDVLRKPLDVAHHVAHVHQDLQLFEADGEHDQGLPRVSRSSSDPSFLVRMTAWRLNDARTTVAEVRRSDGASTRNGSGSGFRSDSRFLWHRIIFGRV